MSMDGEENSFMLEAKIRHRSLSTSLATTKPIQKIAFMDYIFITFTLFMNLKNDKLSIGAILLTNKERARRDNRRIDTRGKNYDNQTNK